jgi:predicted DsbA family dithiol-disulfide isomerase
LAKPQRLDLAFVSDVACPWCAIGLASLEQALARLPGEFRTTLRFEPFELNPDMGAEGMDLMTYITRKYGRTPDQVAQVQARIRERGAAVGFAFGPRTRVWNTFDAHRMLHWAGLEGRALELKRAILRAYHGEGRNPGARDVLVELAGEVGLDAARAKAILESDEFASEVRERERHWLEMGVGGVPLVVVNDTHGIEGRRNAGGLRAGASGDRPFARHAAGMNGARSLVDTLIGCGVDTCFANPGTSEMHFVAALDQTPGMRCVLGLHETIATGMADGYFRIAGKPACTLLHCGPGLANGLTNLHNARRARSGIVNIVGDQATYHRPLDAPLTADTEEMARTVSAWVRTVMRAGDVGRHAAEAVRAARTTPGQIATLILPSDASWDEGGAVAAPLAIPDPPATDAAAVDAAARVLSKGGGNVLLLLGGRATLVESQELAWRIAQRTGASLMGEFAVAHVARGRWPRPDRTRALQRRPRRRGAGEVRAPHPREREAARGLLRVSRQALEALPAERAAARALAPRPGSGRPRCARSRRR